MEIEKYLKSENDILNRIANEIDGECSDTNIGPSMGHGSHSSGHRSSGGHFSSTAQVEKPLEKEKE